MTLSFSWLARVASADSLALGARCSLAAIFFRSGHLKLDSWNQLNDSTLMLFAEEYRLPLLAPNTAGMLTAYLEHLLPLLLVLGLGTRFAAAGILAMTLVIQVLVYPSGWPGHLSWGVMAILLMRDGGGKVGLDALLARRTA